MKFENNYTNPMDREYYSKTSKDYFVPEEPRTYNLDESDEIEKPIIKMNEVKPSIAEGRAAGGTFKSGIMQRLRLGASGGELNLSAEGEEAGVGAESYGIEARKELKQLTDLNRFKVSVHAPVRTIPNLSGFNNSDSFDEKLRESELNEIKKAIRFAADIAGERNVPDSGIPIVVHTGEFPRTISEVESQRDEKGNLIFDKDNQRVKRGPFVSYNDEDKEIPLYLVDEESGKIIGSLKSNQKIPMPKWKRASETKTYYDERLNKTITLNKDDFVDIYGRLALSPDDRIVEKNPNGDIAIELKNLYESEEDKQEYLNWLKKVTSLKEQAEDEDTRKKIETSEHEYNILKNQPREMFFFRESLLSNKRKSQGLAKYHSQGTEKIQERLTKIEKAIRYFSEIKDKVGEEEFKRYFSKYAKTEGFEDILPGDKKDVLESLKEARDELKRQYDYSIETATGYSQEASQVDSNLDKIKPLKEFAEKKTIQTLAEAGLEAYKETVNNKLKKPIFIAPENVFPEMGYGSHPDELIDIIKKSRKKLAEELAEEYNMDKKEAEKIANDHIKATLDTQHLSMWYRYFNPENKTFKNEEEKMKAFEDWYLKQIEKLAKENVLGHVHLVDSFGRAHVHLPAGQGNAPVKKAIEILKKNNVNFDIISEGYSEGPKRQLIKVWEKFDIPTSIFTSGGYKGPRSWTDIDNSYLDKKGSPNYIFGDYSSNKEEWKFWSELPLE